MAAAVRAVDYFYITVRDVPGQAYRFLAALSAAGVNLLAFNIIPVGLEQTQLVVFPEDASKMQGLAEGRNLVISGPQRAFLIQGDDQLGALVDIHRTLAEADINVYASSGVTDGRGGYGYVLYVRSSDFDGARKALGL
jgi:hypothetical protein